MTINGDRVSHEVEPRLLLVHYIRETVGLTGTHWGCDTSNCGACVVLIDGEPDPIQMGFHERHALQCGFCTPGMLMTTRALLDENPEPSDLEIRTAISGAICRCTGYMNIVSAVQWAAQYEAAAKREA